MTKKTKKKTVEQPKSRRARTKYAAVNPQLNLKTRYEEVEDIASYFNTLSEKDKAWMNKFTEEYVNADFRRKGKKIIKTVEGRRAAYNRNNARNRDILTRAKACGKYVPVEDAKGIDKHSLKISMNLFDEDQMIDRIDEDLEREPLKKKSSG